MRKRHCFIEARKAKMEGRWCVCVCKGGQVCGSVWRQGRARNVCVGACKEGGSTVWGIKGGVGEGGKERG